MSDTKVFEFTPNEGCETSAGSGDGVQKVLEDYSSLKTIEGITSYTLQGNLYVVVVTS